MRKFKLYKNKKYFPFKKLKRLQKFYNLDEKVHCMNRNFLELESKRRISVDGP